MELRLNIYKKQNEVEKTYSANTYDLMFGTMEDFIEIIDLDKLSSNKNEDFVSAIARLVTEGMGQLKPLFLDVFEGLTEEELRRTKVNELVTIVFNIIKYSVAQINSTGARKNV